MNDDEPMEFVMTKDKILQVFQWEHRIRYLWTDGRQLPSGENLDNLGPPGTDIRSGSGMAIRLPSTPLVSKRERGSTMPVIRKVFTHVSRRRGSGPIPTPWRCK